MITGRAKRTMAMLTGCNQREVVRPRAYMAELTQQSERSLRRSLSELAALGWIEYFRGGNGTAGKVIIINKKDWVLAPVARECEILARDQRNLAPDQRRISIVLKQEEKERKPPTMEQRQTQNHRPSRFDAERGVDPDELEALLAENRKRFGAEGMRISA